MPRCVAETAVGLDGNTADIAVLQTPDGNGRIEMFQYVYRDAIEVEPVQPNPIGMHRACLTVDEIDATLEIAARHGCHPLRGIATYEDWLPQWLLDPGLHRRGRWLRTKRGL